jgi:hypothetical protein
MEAVPMTRGAFAFISLMTAAMSACSSDSAPQEGAPTTDGDVAEGSSDGSSSNNPEGGPASDAPVTSCTDGIKNGDESDVDCGGDCSPCQLNKACRAHSDCASAHCIDGKCLECAPGTIECQGNKPATCMNGMWMVATNDCPSMCDVNTGMCVAGSE